MRAGGRTLARLEFVPTPMPRHHLEILEQDYFSRSCRRSSADICRLASPACPPGATRILAFVLASTQHRHLEILEQDLLEPISAKVIRR